MKNKMLISLLISVAVLFITSNKCYADCQSIKPCQGSKVFCKIGMQATEKMVLDFIKNIENKKLSKEQTKQLKILKEQQICLSKYIKTL